MKDSRTSSIVLHNLLIAVLAFIWLIPIIWLLCTSFSAYSGMNTSTFFPKEWSISNYMKLFHSDSVSQFPQWFLNTFIIASIPGNRFRITAMFISGFLILNLITDVAYATISTNIVEITHVKHAMINVFRKITMPYLLFVTGPALITDFVKNINNFNVIYLLTQDVYTTTNLAMASSQAKEVDLLVTWLFPPYLP